MSEGFFNTTPMRILGALVLLMVIIALGSYASVNYGKVEFLNPAPATISVVGEGEVLAVPDIGQFSFSVTAEGENAAVAQEVSGVAVNKILAFLQEEGIVEKDIKVQNYNLQPKWRWETPICPTGVRCSGGERVSDGFEVSQSVSVKVRDTAAAGSIIAGVGEREATNISNLNFTIDDIDLLQEEARDLAITDAQEKAVVLAQQLGVQVVRLVSFHENGGNYYEPNYAFKTLALDSAEGGFSGPELPVGEESTTVRVTIVYEIR